MATTHEAERIRTTAARSDRIRDLNEVRRDLDTGRLVTAGDELEAAMRDQRGIRTRKQSKRLPVDGRPDVPRPAEPHRDASAADADRLALWQDADEEDVPALGAAPDV
jgi:hypothetical protein